MERRYSISRSDIERVMQHYNVDYIEAERMVAEKGMSALLPTRGTRIQTNSPNWMLVATGIGAVLSGIVTIWLGLRGERS